ncbi:hypothetical protein AB0L41_47480 [Amycolatopsis mediterranei]|uniref:glycosyltransferase n=1 Tax=Amycolatopsis mediterranei TaxID=33910 RepID=UPI0034254F93
MNIAFLATGWGARLGGINSFNTDLAVAVSEISGVKVLVTAVDPSALEVEEAQKHGIELVPINQFADDGRLDETSLSSIQKAMRKLDWMSVDWWIGHDVVSGDAARFTAESINGSVALIHHMSYQRYQAVKHDQSDHVEKQLRRQRSLFSHESTKLFAVGPLLRESCEELSGRPAIEITPGLSQSLGNRSPVSRLAAITIGRVGGAEDRIKQGRLVAAAFGRAVRMAREQIVPISSLERPTLMMLGVDEGTEAEYTALAEHEAECVLSIVAQPFQNDRKLTQEKLAEANVALMLSWHEGFGLAGWEAISTETPLILSSDSGLFHLLNLYLGGAGVGSVEAIALEGRRGMPGQPNYSERDLQNVSLAIARVAANMASKRKDAKRLKATLLSELQCTWRTAAEKFVDSLKDGPPDSRARNRTTRRERGMDATASLPSYERLSSYDEYFTACAREVNASSVVLKTLVGPTFLEPSWWHDRSAEAGITVELSIVLKEKILHGSFTKAELILRNDLLRYGRTLAEFVVDKNEWNRLLDEMHENSGEIFGSQGERGPRFKCIDTGFSHLPTICENSVVIATRSAPQQRVHGGWLSRHKPVVEMEYERWRTVFDGIEQSQRQAIQKLSSFIEDLRSHYSDLR